MKSATDPNNTRHRLLDGVLLRLTQLPNASDFVLRGGLLMRHWFHPVPRPADDVDLVCLLPFDVEKAARKFLPVLANTTVADGVTFDPDRTRVTGIRLATDIPGLRVFATGTFEGDELDFNVDITFGPIPRPAAIRSELPTDCGQVAKLWTCRPECVTGQKVQALRFRGGLGWRPKDLNDLRLLLAHVPMNARDVRWALAAYLGDLGGTLTDARTLFDPSRGWDTKFFSARWQDYVRSSPDRNVPRDLTAIVAEIAGRLAPILEDAP